MLLIITYLPNVTRHQPRLSGMEWCGWREAEVSGGVGEGRLEVSGGEPKACILPLTLVWFDIIIICSCWFCVKNHWNYSVLKT
jgi:hypothetical protein